MSTASEAAETLSNTGKRLRTSKPKVRSGCVTCKARRIKCDEMKPACDRCTKFGRECGGYKHNLSYEERVASRNRQNLLPKVEQVSHPSIPQSQQRTFSIPTPPRLVLDLGLSAQQVFCIEASLELCRVLDSPQWISTNLHICKQFPFLRHAFSAIRLLSKRPSSIDFNDPSLALLASIDPQLGPRHPNFAAAHHEYFLEGARLALPTGYSDPTQAHLAAMVCLLTICLETLQFHYHTAASHVQISLILITPLLAIPYPPPSPPHGTSGIEPARVQLDPSFINNIVSIFRMIEGKAMVVDGGLALYLPLQLGVSSPFLNAFGTTQEALEPLMADDFSNFGTVSSPPYDVSTFGSRGTSVSTP